ncbi:hypothetical protein BDZ94DRAFT_1327603 [Collybia nuda]|uniref:Uncharacterized protein n=1 Tax=Collybia nuda TaxID=64659 RepID=A0A9P5XRE8_9AGAR|nr:hypothetical protein BDZ94DRAFT_1327603 [Collybia nuda]
MILRTYALYGQSRFILIPLIALWLLQLTLSSIAMHIGFALSLPPGFVGCVLTGSNMLSPALWVTPLITDSAIFLLTIWRTRNFIKEHKNTPTIYIFLRDGVMYFFVIFLANLLNTLICFLAVDDLKSVGASFSQLITATMISRLVLNLRSTGIALDGEATDPQMTSIKFMRQTLASLGGEVVSAFDRVNLDDDNDNDAIPISVQTFTIARNTAL